ncbi:AraC family transcriptional regulator [Thaumasiovibrio sp. DFM-14]|uniref:AraC family transcriptional regulator n=1 Tax=Thaumasiovibrio sp. DFM-14 TaxID=3384792 RepID=UPI0039A1478E
MDAQTEVFLNEEKVFRRTVFSAPRFDNPYHFHELIEIVYIQEGTGTLISGKEVIKYQPNDLIFISSNLPHRFLTDNETKWSRSVLIQFTPEIFSPELLSVEFLSAISNLLKYKHYTYIKNTHCEVLINHLQSITSSSNGDIIGSLIAVLDRIATDFDSYVLREKNHFEFSVSRITPIFEWIGTNYIGEITTGQLAKKVNMDVSSFCRQFKSTTGVTVREYVNQLRVADAYSQLITTNKTICEISLSVGYSSSSVFCRNFKKILGISASSIRKQW